MEEVRISLLDKNMVPRAHIRLLSAAEIACDINDQFISYVLLPGRSETALSAQVPGCKRAAITRDTFENTLFMTRYL